MLTETDRARVREALTYGCWSCAEVAKWILIHDGELSEFETQTALNRLTESRADCEALERLSTDLQRVIFREDGP